MTGYGKTFALMAALTALFMGIGAMLGGATVAVLALVVAAGMNLIGYWNADKAVLRMTGAREVTAQTAPDFVGMVHRLADGAGMPRPKVCSAIPSSRARFSSHWAFGTFCLGRKAKVIMAGVTSIL